MEIGKKSSCNPQRAPLPDVRFLAPDDLAGSSITDCDCQEGGPPRVWGHNKNVPPECVGRRGLHIAASAMECSICMEPTEEADFRLPCGHVFHARCAASWLWTSRSCPNCRMRPQEPAGADEIQPQHVDLGALLEYYEQLEAERRRAFECGMRMASRDASSPTLKAAAARYRDNRKRLANTRREIREVDVTLRSSSRSLRARQAAAYKAYLAEYRRLEREGRASTAAVRRDRAKAMRRFRGQVSAIRDSQQRVTTYGAR